MKRAAADQNGICRADPRPGAPAMPIGQNQSKRLLDIASPQQLGGAPRVVSGEGRIEIKLATTFQFAA